MAKLKKQHSDEAILRWGRSKVNHSTATTMAHGHISKASSQVVDRFLGNANPVIKQAAAVGLNHLGQKGFEKAQIAAAKKLTAMAAEKGAKAGLAKTAVKGLTLVAEDAPVVGAVVGGSIGAYHGVRSWHSHRKAKKAADQGDFETAAKHLDKHHSHKRDAIVNAGAGAVSLIPGYGTAAAVAIQAGDLATPARKNHTAASAKLHFQQNCRPRTKSSGDREHNV